MAVRKAVRKGDITIGYRAYEEVLRLFPRMKDAAAALGCLENNIYQWGNGICPSAKFLARLIDVGADVYYILKGRRSRNASRIDKYSA